MSADSEYGDFADACYVSDTAADGLWNSDPPTDTTPASDFSNLSTFDSASSDSTFVPATTSGNGEFTLSGGASPTAQVATIDQDRTDLNFNPKTNYDTGTLVGGALFGTVETLSGWAGKGVEGFVDKVDHPFMTLAKAAIPFELPLEAGIGTIRGSYDLLSGAPQLMRTFEAASPPEQSRMIGNLIPYVMLAKALSAEGVGISGIGIDAGPALADFANGVSSLAKAGARSGILSVPDAVEVQSGTQYALPFDPEARFRSDVITAGMRSRNAIGNRPGMAATLSIPEVGNVVGFSGAGGPINPELAAVGDSLVDRSPFHLRCAETNAISHALDSGLDLDGSSIQTFRLRGANLGAPEDPCLSCGQIHEYYGIDYYTEE